MRRTALLALAICLVGLAVPATADEIYVPSASPSSPHWNNYPFNPSYGEWRYQLIIPPAMLGGKPYSITEIAFKPSMSGGLICSLFEVRMGHTTVKVSSLFAVNLPNPTTMLTSTNYGWKTTPNAWCPIGLTGLFNYDGTSGLTIEIRHQGGVRRGNFNGTVMGVNTPGGCYRMGKYGTGAYNATSGIVWLKDGLVTRITVTALTITPSGTGQIGSTLTYNLSGAAEAGKPYQVGTSLGVGPTPIGTLSLPLSVDELLKLSTSGLAPGMFVGYVGTLDTQGAGAAKLVIPNIAVLKGVRIYSAVLTLDFKKPFGISQISAKNAMVTIS